MKKRLLSAVLAGSMMLTMLPATAYAAEEPNVAQTEQQEVTVDTQQGLIDALAAAADGTVVKVTAKIELTEGTTASVKSGVTLDVGSYLLTGKVIAHPGAAVQVVDDTEVQAIVGDNTMKVVQGTVEIDFAENTTTTVTEGTVAEVVGSFMDLGDGDEDYRVPKSDALVVNGTLNVKSGMEVAGNLTVNGNVTVCAPATEEGAGATLEIVKLKSGSANGSLTIAENANVVVENKATLDVGEYYATGKIVAQPGATVQVVDDTEVQAIVGDNTMKVVQGTVEIDFAENTTTTVTEGAVAEVVGSFMDLGDGNEDYRVPKSDALVVNGTLNVKSGMEVAGNLTVNGNVNVCATEEGAGATLELVALKSGGQTGKMTVNENGNVVVQSNATLSVANGTFENNGTIYKEADANIDGTVEAVDRAVTGVSVVDGTDGYTPVTNPVEGQKLTANIETSSGMIGSYPVDPRAHYKWYYAEDAEAILGTEPVYTVTADNVDKTLCVEVNVDGCEGTAKWTAEGTVEELQITGVQVVDGTDGYTPVTTPAVGQKLTANIQTNAGIIGSYPVNPDAKYTWHYKDSDAVLGTEPVYTVTEDNDGKILCVDVSVEGYVGTATWTATKAVGDNSSDLPVVDDGGSSGGSGSTTYAVSVETAANGAVSVSPRNASKGATVTITVTPNEGYVLGTLTATDANGDTISLTNAGNGKYTFTMPSSKVTISATFVAESEQELPFTDVASSEWYYEAVQYVYNNELMNGMSATTFEPNSTTTRGMIVTMLYRLENEPAAASAGFTDVAAGQWYTDAVNWAAANQIVNGYGDGQFGPTDTITREQMMAILYRYAQYKGYDVTASASLSAYTDAANISSYAVSAMQWAVGEGLINGITDTTLVPGGSATRAQVAAILMRFCENVAK